jgi:hypothetical protein
LPEKTRGRYVFAGPVGTHYALRVMCMGATNSMVTLNNMKADIFHDFLQAGQTAGYASNLSLALALFKAGKGGDKAISPIAASTVG